MPRASAQDQCRSWLICIRTMNRPVGTPLVWSSAFRRSEPAKAGTPNGRFMERGTVRCSAESNNDFKIAFRFLFLAGRRRRKDVLRFPCLEVVIGLDNVSMSIGRNVKSRPLSTGRQPGLPLAKHSHTLNWNVCESGVCPRVNNFKLIRARQRQVFLLQIRSELIQARRKLVLMICQIMFDGLGEA